MLMAYHFYQNAEGGIENATRTTRNQQAYDCGGS